MKTNWKILLVASVVAAFFVRGEAQQAGPTGGGLQNPPGAKAGAGARMGAMKINREVLEKVQPPLTKEQKKQVGALDKKTAADVKNLREKLKDADRTQIREQIKKITDGYKTALMEILTPAQKTSYQELYKAALDKAMKDRKEGKNGKGGN